ncbi:MAG: hypothetical protein ACOCVM_05025 [Desulfovibrionaceae bacterium]
MKKTLVSWTGAQPEDAAAGLGELHGYRGTSLLALQDITRK